MAVLCIGGAVHPMDVPFPGTTGPLRPQQLEMPEPAAGPTSGQLCAAPSQPKCTPRDPPGAAQGVLALHWVRGWGVSGLSPPTSPMPRGGCTQRGRGAEMGRGWRRGRGDPGGGEGLVLGGHSGRSAHGTPEPFLM